MEAIISGIGRGLQYRGSKIHIFFVIFRRKNNCDETNWFLGSS